MNARLVILNEDVFGYLSAIDDLPLVTRLAQAFHQKVRTSRASSILRLRIINKAVLAVLSLLSFIEALKPYDAYYFQFGLSTLPRNLDLMFLRQIGRRVVMVLGHGSELRPPILETAPPVRKEEYSRYFNRLRKVDRLRRGLSSRIESLGVEIVGCPSTDHYLTKPYWDIVRLGRASTITEPSIPAWTVSGQIPDKKIILHIPSNSSLKGSDKIGRMVTEVCKKDKDFSYRKLEGISRDQVLEEMSRSYLVIDQTDSDVPFSATSFEAGYLGVPCMSGGGWLEFYQARLNKSANSFPIHWDDWEDVEGFLNLIQDPALLVERANKVRDLLKNEWSSAESAKRYLELLEGRLSKEFLSTPSGEYSRGMGLTAEQLEINSKGFLGN